MVPDYLPECPYAASARWWPRVDTPDRLAARWIGLIERLQRIDPNLAEWYEWEDKGAITFDPDRERVRKLIESGVVRNDHGMPDPYYGYQNSAYNTAKRRSNRRLSIRMLAGSATEPNFVKIDTDFGLVVDPAILSYTIFRGAVLALGESFEATSAVAYPTRIFDLWPEARVWSPALNLAWISYVGPQDAHLVTPPLTAIAEHRPDGGLLMAATDETFVTTNPAHLAVARDIEAALAPFNAKMAAEAEARLQERRRAAAEGARRRAEAERSNSR